MEREVLRVLIGMSAIHWHFSQKVMIAFWASLWQWISIMIGVGKLMDYSVIEALFDALPEVVFFIKDAMGCYVVVNRTLADRCAGGDKAKLIGKRPGEVFPAALAASYTRQDEMVLRLGKKVEQQLELHLYPGAKAGWCLARTA